MKRSGSDISKGQGRALMNYRVDETLPDTLYAGMGYYTQIKNSRLNKI